MISCMRKSNIFKCILLSILICGFPGCTNSSESSSSDTTQYWPEITSTMKPWTRWWWMGSAVDKENITRRLEEFSKVGIGGVEITPIFGVKGYEDQFLTHLSPEWMEMLIHTLDEAERFGLGVDMVMGTGWPFGGPHLESEVAAGKLIVQKYTLKEGESFHQHIEVDKTDLPQNSKLQYLLAFDENGTKKDIDSLLVEGNLIWTPDQDYKVYAIPVFREILQYHIRQCFTVIAEYSYRIFSTGIIQQFRYMIG